MAFYIYQLYTWDAVIYCIVCKYGTIRACFTFVSISMYNFDRSGSITLSLRIHIQQLRRINLKCMLSLATLYMGRSDVLYWVPIQYYTGLFYLRPDFDA